MAADRRGQALLELAFGMFALALIVSALCGFAEYIAKSLRAQGELRVSGGSDKKSDSVAFEGFAAENVFGTSSLKIEEKVVMPGREILR